MEMNELVEACKVGRLDDVERLLQDQETELDPSQRSENGWSPLHYASQHGHLPIVEYLLGKGYDPSIEALDKTTPLHLACANNRVDVALCLLQALPRGAPLRKSKDGNTPLHFACKVGSISLAIRVLNYMWQLPAIGSFSEHMLTSRFRGWVRGRVRFRLGMYRDA